MHRVDPRTVEGDRSRGCDGGGEEKEGRGERMEEGEGRERGGGSGIWGGCVE